MCVFEKKIKLKYLLKVANELIADTEMALLVWREFGKGLIKKLRVSPDAFIQMTLQLTYFRVCLLFSNYIAVHFCCVLEPRKVLSDL